MKKQALFWMAAALCGTLTLASCSSEADEPVVAAPAAKQVSVTLTLPGGADTRTAYKEKSDGGLKASWAEGDKITIVVAGKFANCVTLTQTGELDEDATTATFTGDISALGEINESTSLLLFYPEITDGGTKCLDFRNQDGTLENLGKYDFLVDYNVKYKEGKLEPSTTGFERRSSFIRLPKDTPVGGNGNISIELYGDAGIIYSTNAPAGETIYSVEGGGANNILVSTTATNGKLDNDVYIAFAGVEGSINKVYLKTEEKIYKITVADNFKLGKMYTIGNLDVIDLNSDPLTVESLVDGNTIKIKNPLGLTIQYQVNDLEKQTITGDVAINVFTGEKVRFWGDNPAYSDGIDATDVHTSISSTGDIKVYGNIMSLIDSDGFSELKELKETYTFKGLFATDGELGNQYLTDASGLLLPATTLTDYCYYDMFYDCNQMTAGPAQLPAMTLAVSCYENMFKECVQLKTAPALPATTLAKRCYANMFKSCWYALKAAPALPATFMAENCYEYMFVGCIALTTAPALPATTLAKDCYAHMFEECEALAEAPALPATTLANSCYYSMFLGCTSLETAPVLPAETLELYCYEYMFSGCTSLNSVTCLANDIGATYCTNEWLKGVAANGTFYRSPGFSGWGSGDSDIPEGWKVKNYGE